MAIPRINPKKINATRIVVRPLAFAWLLALGVVSALGAAPTEYPYTGTVVVDEASVYSGPGPMNYTTGTLKSGVQVEVYRREPNGWLAIRPPQKSLSFMRSDSLRLSSRGNLAEVIIENATAWVGSVTPTDFPLKWQVRLKKGEIVEILGAVADPEDPQKKLYKISPPAGEFRWLGPNTVSSETPSQGSPSLIPLAANTDNRIKPIESGKENAEKAPAVTGIPEKVVIEIPEQVVPKNDVPEKTIADVPEKEAALSKSAWTSVQEGDAVGFVEIRRRIEKSGGKATIFVKPRIVRALPTSSDGLRKRPGELEVDISLMAAKPRRQWNFGPLRVEVAALLEAVDSTTARTSLQHMQRKLLEFEELSQRPTETNQVDRVVINATAASLSTPVGPNSLDNATVDKQTIDVQSDSRFDGVGWVMPVVSRTRSAPPFALMDDQGQVKALLSPAPGVNLHRYVRQKVGVYGQRGFSPSLNLAHVTARRAVIIERAPKKR